MVKLWIRAHGMSQWTSALIGHLYFLSLTLSLSSDSLVAMVTGCSSVKGVIITVVQLDPIRRKINFIPHFQYVYLDYFLFIYNTNVSFTFNVVYHEVFGGR